MIRNPKEVSELVQGHTSLVSVTPTAVHVYWSLLIARVSELFASCLPGLPHVSW